MAGCCDPRGCDRMFGAGFARRMARRYRRRGLDGTGTRLLDFLAAGGVDGVSVLEIGGGVGEIGVELLRRGAARATCLELSRAYDDQAAALAREAGVQDRVIRRVVDIAETPDQVEQADLVVLNRVVCCYPDHERLLGAAADHTRSRLAYSHPVRNAVSRAMIGSQNGLFALLGREFRAFTHPPEAMVAVVQAHGLSPAYAHERGIWHVRGLVR